MVRSNVRNRYENFSPTPILTDGENTGQKMINVPKPIKYSHGHKPYYNPNFWNEQKNYYPTNQTYRHPAVETHRQLPTETYRPPAAECYRDPRLCAKTWNEYSTKQKMCKKYFSHSPSTNLQISDSTETNPNRVKSYDAMKNCRSAGIIPYTIHGGELMFLFQYAVDPVKKKDIGWNDFGGKKLESENDTMATAAREFGEETNCLFYLKEQIDRSNELDLFNQSDEPYDQYYKIFSDRQISNYDDKNLDILKKIIGDTQAYYTVKINEHASPLFVSSKETYISYFIKVPYINVNDLPESEDMHIQYNIRYKRICKWFTVKEIAEMREDEFHKRLQITRIQQRILNYDLKGVFI